MSDSREQALFQWVEQQSRGGEDLTCQSVSGDASFRNYFRVLRPGQASLVAMDSSLEKSTLPVFIDVAERLGAAGLHPPAVESFDPVRGYALLEDLGDRPLQDELESTAGNKLFADVLPLLLAMAGGVSVAGLPQYSPEKLREELQLFPDWYADQHLQQPFDASEQQVWNEFCDRLVANATALPQVFVHRDFHSCNLHRLEDGAIGIIDFQDAVHGPVNYDLVSWLWDRYIDWPREALERWMLDFKAGLEQEFPQVFDSVAQMSQAEWIRSCDLVGLQRNLKIIGIFSRLNYRDNKPGYMVMIPRFSAYVDSVLQHYERGSAIYSLIARRLDV